MAWEPPSTLEEKLKYALVPPGLYRSYRLWKELRRGEAELHLVPFLVDRGRAALDVGANKGVWTAMLARYCPKVFALEPNPKPFKVLARCKPDNAEAWQIAASNASGEAELRIPLGRKGYSNQGGSLNAAKVGEHFGSVKVPAKRLDDCALPPIGFIKIDVEGFEAEVLEGAAGLIRRDRPVLVIEMEEVHTRKPIETMVGEVVAMGYAAFALRHGQLVPFSALDPEANHRRPASRGDYIFNFIFLPA